MILLAASGTVLFLRFYHPPFHVTWCGDLPARAGRLRGGGDRADRYQRLGRDGLLSVALPARPELPRHLSQSVTAGQQAVYVTAAVQGSGHGAASQTVTLQVLGPDPRSASTAVVLRC